MGVDTTMAVLYAQSGLSNAANVSMVAPQASLAMTRVLAAEEMRQEREKVEKNNKSDKTEIHPDADGRRGFFHTRLRSRKEQEEPEEKAGLPTTALLGNLLNVKV